MFLVNGVMLQGQIAGVRPVLHAAPARGHDAARLQARGLDDPADRSRSTWPRNRRTRTTRIERRLSTSGFDRDRDEFARGARAIVVLARPGRQRARRRGAAGRRPRGLAAAIGIVVADRIALKVRAPRPATLIGSGQAEQLAVAVQQDEAGLVIFDAPLSPVQQRNLETTLEGQGHRPHRADPRNLRRTRGDRRGAAAGRTRASRLSGRAGWCAAGPISSASAAASAFSVAPARRRSRRIAG